jgi:hypothetical protein
MTPLGNKMRDLAKTHPQAQELTDTAKAFEDASVGFYSEPQTVSVKTFMGAYARARHLWCKLTGEDLV